MKSIDFLEANEISFNMIHLKEIPKTAQDVERFYGCSLHQVLKSLVFLGESKKIIAVVPGDKRVDVNKLKKVSGQMTLRIAKPDEVEELTGYSIGGVSPFGIENDIIKIIDKSIFDIETVNIGSGKAEIGIEMASQDLRKVWDGIIADVIE